MNATGFQDNKSEDTLMEINILPLGRDSSVGEEISRAVERVQKSGLASQLTAMGTNVEGSLEECTGLLLECLRDVLRSSPRVTATVTFDIRPGFRGRIKDNVERIEEQIRERNYGVEPGASAHVTFQASS